MTVNTSVDPYVETTLTITPTVEPVPVAPTTKTTPSEATGALMLATATVMASANLLTML